MHPVQIRIAFFAAVVLSAAHSSLIAAVAPSEQLLPNTTKGFFSVGDIEELTKSFDATELGKLVNDPLMKPFIEDMKRQIKKKWFKTDDNLGITWEDLVSVAGGEIAIAIIQPSEDKAATVILVDVTGKTNKAKQLLQKVDGNFAKRKATKRAIQVNGTTITIYKLPKKGREKKSRRAYIFLINNLLCASDDLEVIKGILNRHLGEEMGSLSGASAFQAVMERCMKDAKTLEPHIRWFIEPIAFVETLRIARNTQKRKRKPDLLKILKKQSFTAIRGVGGLVNVGAGRYEVLHRTFVYAPGVDGKTGSAKQRFKLAMRMLSFPNGGLLGPPDWIHRDVATYASFQIGIADAFDASVTLFDEFLGGPGEFKAVLDSIRTDTDGPQIDIRKDFIAYLGTRVTIISDYILPITTTSERMLFAIETTNPDALRITLKKLMDHDEQYQERTIVVDGEEHLIWQMTSEDAKEPEVDVTFLPGEEEEEEDDGLLPGQERDEEEEEDDDKDKPIMPHVSVTIANGHLLIASHFEFLEKVLNKVSERERLSNTVDFQIGAGEMKKLGAGPLSLRTFSRTDEALRPTYELIRQGLMPASETLLGIALNRLLGDEKEETPRMQQIDGSKLPDFEVVRRHLGTSGTFSTTEQDGWYLTGFMLSKSNPNGNKLAN